MANGNNGLFGNSNNVSDGATATLGDLASTLGVGIIAYLLIVIFFIFGFWAAGSHFKNEQNNNPSNPSNLVQLLIKPFFWWIGGVLTYMFISKTILLIYNVDFNSKIKTLLGLRYEGIISSIKSSKTLESSFFEFIAVATDIFSKIVFWSIPFFCMIFIFLTIGFMSNILLSESSNDAIWKKVFLCVAVGITSIILVNTYFMAINQVFFKDGATIPNLGFVDSVSDANVRVIKYFIKTGLNF